MPDFDGTQHLRPVATDVTGTVVGSTIVPGIGENSAQPTHYSWLGHGGFKVARTVAEMYEIPFPRRELGMRVFVLENEKLYRLIRQAIDAESLGEYYNDGSKVGGGTALTVAEMAKNTDVDCWTEIFSSGAPGFRYLGLLPFNTLEGKSEYPAGQVIMPGDFFYCTGDPNSVVVETPEDPVSLDLNLGDVLLCVDTLGLVRYWHLVTSEGPGGRYLGPAPQSLVGVTTWLGLPLRDGDFFLVKQRGSLPMEETPEEVNLSVVEGQVILWDGVSWKSNGGTPLFLGSGAFGDFDDRVISRYPAAPPIVGDWFILSSLNGAPTGARMGQHVVMSRDGWTVVDEIPSWGSYVGLREPGNCYNVRVETVSGYQGRIPKVGDFFIVGTSGFFQFSSGGANQYLHFGEVIRCKTSSGDVNTPINTWEPASLWHKRFAGTTGGNLSWIDGALGAQPHAIIQAVQTIYNESFLENLCSLLSQGPVLPSILPRIVYAIDGVPYEVPVVLKDRTIIPAPANFCPNGGKIGLIVPWAVSGDLRVKASVNGLQDALAVINGTNPLLLQVSVPNNCADSSLSLMLYTPLGKPHWYDFLLVSGFPIVCLGIPSGADWGRIESAFELSHLEDIEMESGLVPYLGYYPEGLAFSGVMSDTLVILVPVVSDGPYSSQAPTLGIRFENGSTEYLTPRRNDFPSGPDFGLGTPAEWSGPFYLYAVESSGLAGIRFRVLLP